MTFEASNTKIIDARDAVAAALERDIAAGRLAASSPVRTSWLPIFKREDFSSDGVIVSVMPSPDSADVLTLSSRSMMQHSISLLVACQSRATSPDDASVSAAVSAAESVIAARAGVHIDETDPPMLWSGAEHTSAISFDDLRERNIATSLVTLTYEMQSPMRGRSETNG